MGDGEEEQFSLCWNNYSTNLSTGFHESLCRGDLVDVTLAAEGHLVKAHRLVLSVCSPYFQKMFTTMPANQHAFGKLNFIAFLHYFRSLLVIFKIFPQFHEKPYHYQTFLIRFFCIFFLF